MLTFNQNKGMLGLQLRRSSMSNFRETYEDYKAESNLLNLTPNNLFHFVYLYFFTDTYK